MIIVIWRIVFILLLLVNVVLYVGCETIDDQPYVYFHYYKIGEPSEEVTPKQVHVLAFKGIRLPLFPTNFFRQEASIQEIPMLNVNQVTSERLLYEDGIFCRVERNPCCTLIFFDEYYPVDLTLLVEELQKSDYTVGRNEFDAKGRCVQHIILPLIPKEEVSSYSSHRNQSCGTVINGYHYPFLQHKDRSCFSIEALKTESLGIQFIATPDILPLNRYYRKLDADSAFKLAYPKVQQLR